jgi:hypothetical protein
MAQAGIELLFLPISGDLEYLTVWGTEIRST